MDTLATLTSVVFTGLELEPQAHIQFVIAKRVANEESPTIPGHVRAPEITLILSHCDVDPCPLPLPLLLPLPQITEIVHSLVPQEFLVKLDIDGAKRLQMPKAIARTPLMKYGVDRCEKFLR
jgi:hypothetical protein